MQKIENEVRPTQTNGVQWVKRFVSVHLHCIVSNLKRISSFDIAPPGKISADADVCTDFNLILGS